MFKVKLNPKKIILISVIFLKKVVISLDILKIIFRGRIGDIYHVIDVVLALMNETTLKVAAISNKY